MTNYKLDTLHKIFPQIFTWPEPSRFTNKDWSDTPWPFECGEGWADLIHDLCTEILDECKYSGCRIPVAEQVKEKFGGLRFYVDQASPEVYGIIDKFESYSYKVCEVCGDPGTPRPGGWTRTLCDHHSGVKNV